MVQFIAYRVIKIEGTYPMDDFVTIQANTLGEAKRKLEGRANWLSAEDFEWFRKETASCE